MSLPDDIVAWVNANRTELESHEFGCLAVKFANGYLVSASLTKEERVGKEFSIDRKEKHGAAGLDTNTNICYN